jgi:hypothetical protein
LRSHFVARTFFWRIGMLFFSSFLFERPGGGGVRVSDRSRRDVRP